MSDFQLCCCPSTNLQTSVLKISSDKSNLWYTESKAKFTHTIKNGLHRYSYCQFRFCKVHANCCIATWEFYRTTCTITGYPVQAKKKYPIARWNFNMLAIASWDSAAKFTYHGSAHTGRRWSASATSQLCFTTTQAILTTTHNVTNMLEMLYNMHFGCFLANV